MKNKYILISGTALGEESDMKKLNNCAKEGWILEGIKGSFFYKLRKDKPQDIVYTLGYQSETDEEYFHMFKEAGWSHVVSIGGEINIFFAPRGTKPIYSDAESEVNKYISAKNSIRNVAIYSLILGIVLMGLLALSIKLAKPMFLVVVGLLLIDMVVFIFAFMPYVSYNYRIKQIKKYGECSDADVNNRNLIISYSMLAFVFLLLGIRDLIEKKYFGFFFVAIGIYNLVLMIIYYKRYKSVSND